MKTMQPSDIKDLGQIQRLFDATEKVLQGTAFGIKRSDNPETIWFFGPAHSSRVDRLQEKYVSIVYQVLKDYQTDLQELALFIAEQQAQIKAYLKSKYAL